MAKRRMLKREFELFKMKENESIKHMADRLAVITNEHTLLDKPYDMEEKVSQFFSLPQAKVMAIKEAKHLTTITIDELIGNLMTHELALKEEQAPTTSTTEKRDHR